MDGLGSVDPLLQMVQCQGVVLHESIKIGLTQAIAGIANGVAQNLQQKNIAQQVGQQGGGVLNQSLNNTGFSLIPQKPKPADYNNWNSIDKNVFDVLGFKPRNKYTLYDNDAPWMRIAVSQLNVIEKTGNNDGPDVEKYLKTVGLGPGKDSYWCGAFVNWVLKESRIKGAQSPAWALDWRNFGQKLNQPAYGSIATFERKGGGGHVGFVAGITSNGRIVLLGGNQGNMVKYESFKSSKMRFNYPNRYIPNYSLPIINVGLNSRVE